MTERQRSIADWLKVAGVVFAAGGFFFTNSADHKTYEKSEAALIVRVDSLKAIAADVRDIKTLICKDHPDDSLCGARRP